MKIFFEHLPISLTIGLVGWWISNNSLCILLAIMAGWLIDADHLVDLFVYVRRAKVGITKSLVLNGNYFKENGKVLVPLHAWEITIVLIFLAVFYDDAKVVFMCMALAHGAHLLQDQLRYRMVPNFYWFWWRCRRHFEINKLRGI